MNKPPQPRCPKCGRKSKPFGVTGELAYCSWCAATFDAIDPDEGSDVFNDPTRRMMLQEEEALRKRGLRR